MGLPVPVGFIITAETCQEFHEANDTIPENLFYSCKTSVAHMEQKIGKIFGGDPERSKLPLLLSVRRGSFRFEDVQG